VEGGKIAAIGRGLPAPPHAQVIEGGRTTYLSPGLADMHTHSETRKDLAAYLANGVTTVSHMGGARPSFVDTLVPAVNRGAAPGPHVYSSFKVHGSPAYNGFVIRTPAEARARNPIRRRPARAAGRDGQGKMAGFRRFESNDGRQLKLRPSTM
jgi:hypothetical protein